MTATQERVYRDVIDKSAWERGPWDDEPDKVQWVDESTGLDCLAVRVDIHGGWCGYVGVPSDHPWHGTDYSECLTCGEAFCSEHEYTNRPEGRIEVHGGLTFADSCNESGPVESSVCHIPFDGRPDDIWWFGFDCAHARDYSPGTMAILSLLSAFRGHHDDSVYRTLNYVRAECARLAEQLNAVLKEAL